MEAHKTQGPDPAALWLQVPWRGARGVLQKLGRALALLLLQQPGHAVAVLQMSDESEHVIWAHPDWLLVNQHQPSSSVQLHLKSVEMEHYQSTWLESLVLLVLLVGLQQLLQADLGQQSS